MNHLREHIRASNGYKWWILGLIMLGTFMAVLDVTVVNVGLPAIMSAFHTGISTAEWVVTAYMITMTIMLPSAGWIADRFGNKRIFILGLLLFTLGSWLCGRAHTDTFLIASRALQGIGSGIIQALGLAIVTREFPVKQRGLALGLWAVAAAASISFGPLIGGYLVDDYSWHLIFDVNVPVGLFAILLSLFIQKEWRKEEKTPFDWIGLVTVILFMPLSIYALARGNSPTNPHGWASPDIVICFCVAAVALIAFIVRELHTKYPMLDLRLLGERNFGVSMAAMFIFVIGMFGGTYLLPLYMQKGLGYTAIMAGSVFLPVGLIQGLLSTISGFLTRYLRTLPLIFAGILIMALSFYLASRFTAQTTHRHILGVLYLRGLGMGLTFAPLSFFSLRNLRQESMAAAAGISNSVKQLSGSISIALLTTIMTARTVHHAAHEHVPAQQIYIEGITDDFLLVTIVTLCSLLPFLWLLRRSKTPPASVAVRTDRNEQDSSQNKVPIERVKTSHLQNSMRVEQEKIVLPQNSIPVEQKKTTHPQNKVPIERIKISRLQNSMRVKQEKIVLSQNRILIEQEKIMLSEKDIPIGQGKAMRQQNSIPISSEEK